MKWSRNLTYESFDYKMNFLMTPSVDNKPPLKTPMFVIITWANMFSLVSTSITEWAECLVFEIKFLLSTKCPLAYKWKGCTLTPSNTNHGFILMGICRAKKRNAPRHESREKKSISTAWFKRALGAFSDACFLHLGFLLFFNKVD